MSIDEQVKATKRTKLRHVVIKAMQVKDREIDHVFQFDDFGDRETVSTGKT